MLRNTAPLSRRVFLGATSAFVLTAARARAGGGPRVAALNWASAQALLALGITPLGLPEVERYARLAVEPAAPPGAQELGLRSEPNLELLASLAPDLLVLGEDLAGLQPRLAPIAPTWLYEPDQTPPPDRLLTAQEALSRLAAQLGAGPACQSFIAEFETTLSEARQNLRGYDGRPVFIATVLDGRRMLVFGKNSLFQAVLDRLGIENAWGGFTSRYGHATVNVDRLTDRPEARLLCVGNAGLVTLERLRAAPVLASLPAVRENRISLMPEVLFYGGLPPALRFARLAPTALLAEG